MLLYFLRWLRTNTDIEFSLILLEGGPLVDDYAAVAPVRVFGELRRSRLSRLLERGHLHPVASAIRSLTVRRWCWPFRRTPLVYCNSITSVRILPLLGRHERVVVSHVHELELAISVQMPAADRERLFADVDRYVAASDLVKANLVGNHGVGPELVARHYEFIDVDAFLRSVSEQAVPEEASDLRTSLGIPPEALVVGAVGVAESRKGPDLFLALAMAFRRRDLGRPVHFVWVGADPAGEGTQWMTHDIDRAGLGDVVHVRGSQSSPAPWFDLFDVLTLTSREDPFPLVCLESSLLGTPIVCFDNTGMAEFAGDGERGFVVPYLDVHAMADRVEALLRDPELTAAVGARASAQVRAYHDASHGAPRLFADIEAWRRGAEQDRG